MKIKGQIVDIPKHRTFKGEISIENGRIQSIIETDDAPDHYILPGFVDAHIHHEIANVLGVEGVRFMIENGKKTPLKFNFGAPSCVPATTFETAGAVVTPEDIDELLADPDIRYLAEMMNYPGVIFTSASPTKKPSKNSNSA